MAATTGRRGCSHSNVAGGWTLLRKLRAEEDAWEVVTFDDEAAAPISYMKPVLAAG